MGIPLNLPVALNTVDILTILILPIHENRIFPIICVFFNFFHQCLEGKPFKKCFFVCCSHVELLTESHIGYHNRLCRDLSSEWQPQNLGCSCVKGPSRETLVAWFYCHMSQREKAEEVPISSLG